jgi:hypothetical protein
MDPSISVDWVTDSQGFTVLAEEWDALLPEDVPPFDLHCWYAAFAWWEAFGGDAQLAVCALRHGGQAGRCPAAVPRRMGAASAGEQPLAGLPAACERRRGDGGIDGRGDEPGGVATRVDVFAPPGETAAFDFCLLHCGRLYLLKTGFDERFRRLAPGLVMRLSIIERCFESGLDVHELLGEESD